MTSSWGFLDKAKHLLSKIVEPHPSIQGIRIRQQSRLVSSLLLLAIPIFAFVQFTSELVLFSTPIFLGAIILVFLLYLGTKTKYYDVVVVIALAGITLLPTIIFLFGAGWTPDDLPRLMVWILVALVGGALLSKTTVVLVQGITMVITMTFIVVVIFGVPITAIDSHIGTAVVVTFFVLIVSYTLEEYVGQVDQRTGDLTRRQWELEVYTQLLRHDLRNDLQAILGLIEVAELFVDLDSEKVKESLSQSLSLGSRMVQLLHVFSMSLEQPGTDLVKHIEEVALETQKIHRELKIEVSSGTEVSKATFTASRLLPMVWQNLFRNAAQYAGVDPTVQVDVSVEGDVFVVSITDDGPGIPEEKREYLFRRGSGVDSEESGLGLYLSKMVLESHGGSIDLDDGHDSGGARFIIRIPTSQS
ncbi:MAG: sensor histidine kinase [Candidatus Thorarchaeota archaeon]|jgi:signal transduction histidine kinase